MAKDWIKRGLVASGLTRLGAGLAEPGVAILMYHSVMDEPERELNTLGGIVHSTEVFTRQIEILAREYLPVTLDDVLDSLTNRNNLPRRAVVVTFDDGYADNHDVALPILQRAGVPATFYVTVDCVENQSLPWTGRLRHAFFTTAMPSWKEEGKNTWTLASSQDRERAFLRACDLCAKLAGPPQKEFVGRMESELAVGRSSREACLMMNWEQVRALARTGHIVGSHTLTHPNMAQVDESSARQELAESRRKLEQILQQPVVHFSYPCPALFPAWSRQTVEMSREVGYRTAVTTAGGIARKQDDPLCLRRVRPSRDALGLRWNLECAFLGRAV